MSLDTIKATDIPRGRVHQYKDEDRSLKTDDIQRCNPTYPWMKYLEKPTYAHGTTNTHDIAGGRAKSYYPPMDRRPRDLSLTTADIEYAQPKNVKFRGNRHSDPVQPYYKMASSEVRPATPVRYGGRETNDVSDIEMAQPKRLIPDRNYTRDPNDSTDIAYSAPNYRRRVVRPLNPETFSTSLHVKDITEDGPRRAVREQTNPLDPTYKVPTSSATSLDILWNEEQGAGLQKQSTMAADVVGPVAGSKPRKLTWDNQEPLFSLLREDIAGAAPQRWIGATPFNVYDPPAKKPVISFHDPHDVPGAQVGSLRRGIGSTRMTNPLNPKYQMLDGMELTYQAEPVMEAERGYPPNRAPPRTIDGQPMPSPFAGSDGLARGGASQSQLEPLRQQATPVPSSRAVNSGREIVQSSSGRGTPTGFRQ